MTNRDVALLGFKLLGLWLMAKAAIGVASIPYYWEPQFEGIRTMTVFATLLPALVSVGIGVPVWFSSDWLAGRVFPGMGPRALEPDRLRGEPLFALALSIMGTLFVCESLPGVVNAIALFAQSRRVGSSVLGPDVDQQRLIWGAAAKANVTAAIARFLIGIALLAGPARLAAAARRIRKELGGTLADEGSGDRRVESPSSKRTKLPKRGVLSVRAL